MNWLTSRILDAESQIKNLVTVATSALVTEETKTTSSEDESDYGIDATIMEFVDSICDHPNTFRDFPIQNYGALSKKLTPKQEKHAVIMLNKVPELSKLRYKLCPGIMKEEMFWRIYFLLLHNKIGYIFSDEVDEEENNNNDLNNSNESVNDSIDEDNNSGTNNDSENSGNNDVNTSVNLSKGKTAYEHTFLTPNNNKRRASSFNTPRSNSNNNSPSMGTPRNNSSNNTASPQTPSEIEDYFEKIWTPASTPIDEGIEADFDSYFSPKKLSYEIDT